MIYEEGDLEDDFAVYCQYSDGCTDGIWHGIVHGTRTTGAALGARVGTKKESGSDQKVGPACLFQFQIDLAERLLLAKVVA